MGSEMCIRDSNYLNQAINLLDELFGKNDYEDRLGYVFDKFCIGK